MENNLSLGDLSDAPTPAAAPTARVASVEDKHGDRKDPAITEEKSGEPVRLGAIMRAMISNLLRQIDKDAEPELFLINIFAKIKISI